MMLLLHFSSLSLCHIRGISLGNEQALLSDPGELTIKQSPQRMDGNKDVREQPGLLELIAAFLDAGKFVEKPLLVFIPQSQGFEGPPIYRGGSPVKFGPVMFALS